MARTRISGTTRNGVSTLTVSPRDPGGVADEYLSKKLVLRIHTPDKLTVSDASTGSPMTAMCSDGVITAELPFSFAGGCVRAQ